MKIRELREFTGHSLKYHQKSAWFMACSCPAVWLIMKFLPDMMAGMLVMQNLFTPAEIFFSRDKYWTLFLLLWHFLEFCILVPMLCCTGDWFSERLGFSRKRYQFGYGKLWIKSLWFFGKIQIIRFLMLFPFILACALASESFQKCILTEDAGLWLFLMIQCITAAVWTGFFYLRFCISLTAVLFLFLENPDISALKAVWLSGKILSGYYQKLFLILSTGGTLPRTVTMLILCLQIRIREYFQECQNSQYR